MMIQYFKIVRQDYPSSLQVSVSQRFMIILLSLLWLINSLFIHCFNCTMKPWQLAYCKMKQVAWCKVQHCSTRCHNKCLYIVKYTKMETDTRPSSLFFTHKSEYKYLAFKFPIFLKEIRKTLYFGTTLHVPRSQKKSLTHAILCHWSWWSHIHIITFYLFDHK